RNKIACVAKITEDDVHQTYEVRKLLEPYATSLVAKKVKSDSALKDDLQELACKIEEIHEIATNTSLSSSQYEEYLQIDLGVNAVILKALENTLLRKLLSLVNNHSRRVRSFTEAISKPREAKIIRLNNKEHLTIIKALMNGDSERTKEAVQQHLHNVENRTTDAIKNSYDEVQNRAEGG
ncbi:MAG: GntR family transcriptional regulator, partial [Desulfobacteraceae bacterium]|nr:GntR family transcriptional regulator [Desulfobacteraceae bacterium]